MYTALPYAATTASYRRIFATMVNPTNDEEQS
jgi:hypothetical protein